MEIIFDPFFLCLISCNAFDNIFKKNIIFIRIFSCCFFKGRFYFFNFLILKTILLFTFLVWLRKIILFSCTHINMCTCTCTYKHVYIQPDITGGSLLNIFRHFLQVFPLNFSVSFLCTCTCVYFYIEEFFSPLIKKHSLLLFYFRCLSTRSPVVLVCPQR